MVAAVAVGVVTTTARPGLLTDALLGVAFAGYALVCRQERLDDRRLALVVAQRMIRRGRLADAGRRHGANRRTAAAWWRACGRWSR